MPSKKIEELPQANVPLVGPDDLMHVAQKNGAGTYDSRHAKVMEVAAALSTPLLGEDVLASGVTTYTLVPGDNYRSKHFTCPGAATLVVAPHSTQACSVGHRTRVSQKGAGQITITPGVGVTIHSADSALKSRVQFSVFELEQIATDEWNVLGDVTA